MEAITMLQTASSVAVTVFGSGGGSGLIWLPPLITGLFSLLAALFSACACRKAKKTADTVTISIKRVAEALAATQDDQLNTLGKAMRNALDGLKEDCAND